ncbi:MAG: transmembrane anchor protein [Xanthomonadales bacterium]|nr:transmembrane anchor protein [Xanthomonadales bacterium]
MYNSEIPNREELPSARRLLRSTILALVAALVILVTMVLPAEYGIDPTGIGRVLGLAEMGEIKAQLAEEAEADRQQHAERAETARKQSMLDQTLGFFFASAHAQTSEDGTAALEAGPAEPQDRFVVTLAPGAYVEAKLIMDAGAVASYRWQAEGGLINYDLHGHGREGESESYDKGRGVSDRSGTFTAAFAGEHGWFFRNRDKQDLTLTFEVQGDYSEFRQAGTGD